MGVLRGAKMRWVLRADTSVVSAVVRPQMLRGGRNASGSVSGRPGRGAGTLLTGWENEASEETCPAQHRMHLERGATLNRITLPSSPTPSPKDWLHSAQDLLKDWKGGTFIFSQWN